MERTLGNMNLCKHNAIAAIFDPERRVCEFNAGAFDKPYVMEASNKYHCIKNISGYCAWN